MKGIAIEQVAFVVLLVAVIAVGITIIAHFSNKTPDMPKIEVDVRYICDSLNDTEIGFSEFKDVLYGFLTAQCNDFVAISRERITFDDVRRATEGIDKKYSVFKIESCVLPSVRSGSVYVNFNEIEAGQSVQMTRKGVDNADVLICFFP